MYIYQYLTISYPKYKIIPKCYHSFCRVGGIVDGVNFFPLSLFYNYFAISPLYCVCSNFYHFNIYV